MFKRKEFIGKTERNMWNKTNSDLEGVKLKKYKKEK